MQNQKFPLHHYQFFAGGFQLLEPIQVLPADQNNISLNFKRKVLLHRGSFSNNKFYKKITKPFKVFYKKSRNILKCFI